MDQILIIFLNCVACPNQNDANEITASDVIETEQKYRNELIIKGRLHVDYFEPFFICFEIFCLFHINDPKYLSHTKQDISRIYGISHA